MGGIESGPKGFEENSGGIESNYEYLQHDDSRVISEGTQRGLGHAALDASGVYEPAETSTEIDVSQSLGQTALKNY